MQLSIALISLWASSTISASLPSTEPTTPNENILQERACTPVGWQIGCSKGFCWTPCGVSDGSDGKWCWLMYHAGRHGWVPCQNDAQCQVYACADAAERRKAHKGEQHDPFSECSNDSIPSRFLTPEQDYWAVLLGLSAARVVDVAVKGMVIG